MKQEISTEISELVQTLFAIDARVELSHPEPQFGDFATNIALQLAGRLGRAPRDIAETIADDLRKNGHFTKVEVAGPGFINLTLASTTLFNQLTQESAAAKYRGQQFGESQVGNGKTVVVEFPSPNMAKPYSVGHMRAANQGWAMKQLHEATGWNVITDNHLGDYGTPFGKWVVGFLRYSSEGALAKKGIYELARVYIEITHALKLEKEAGGHELADEVQSWLLKLEDGDPKAQDYSQRFNKLSLDHMHHVMRRLEISTEYELGEAFFVPMGKRIIRELLDSNIAIRNPDNSVIVPLDDQGIDVPALLQKSNGAALYATSDLATIRYREEHWQPHRVLYHVGAEQKFHFTQIFALAKKLGVTTELIHVGHGMIDQITEDGKREKMSSRKGVVLMEDLLNHAEQKAHEMVKGDDLSDDDIHAIALGTIKFTDFAQDRKMGMLFDWHTMFSLTGRSGPFIQYAAVRINKILTDFNGAAATPDPSYDWEAEKTIIAHLLEYPAVVERAAQNCEAHIVATYAYDLARIMNRYYEDTPVATQEVPDQIRQSRLHLLHMVHQNMTHALGLLGIRVPTRM